MKIQMIIDLKIRHLSYCPKTWKSQNNHLNSKLSKTFDYAKYDRLDRIEFIEMYQSI